MSKSEFDLFVTLGAKICLLINLQCSMHKYAKSDSKNKFKWVLRVLGMLLLLLLSDWSRRARKSTGAML